MAAPGEATRPVQRRVPPVVPFEDRFRVPLDQQPNDLDGGVEVDRVDREPSRAVPLEDGFRVVPLDQELDHVDVGPAVRRPVRSDRPILPPARES